MTSWTHSDKLGGLKQRHFPLSDFQTQTSGPWAQPKNSFSVDAILSRDHRVAPMLCVYPQLDPLTSYAYISSKVPYQQHLHQLRLIPFHHRLHHHSYEGEIYDGNPSHPNQLTLGGLRKTCRRFRTIFTTEQLNKLEEAFSKQQYMTGTEKVLLASALHLSETQIKVWFQNRRTKWRKSKEAPNSPCSAEEDNISEDSDNS